jgi:acetyl esterase/lipase
VLIYVHGGGFLGGNRSQMLDEAGPLLHQIDRGFAILNIDYRLGAFPNGVPDANAAVQFVRTRASEFGLNPNTILIGGFSAGGAISANAALSANGTVSANATQPPDDSLLSTGEGQALFGLPQAVDGWVSIAGPIDFYARPTPFWSAPTAWSTMDQRASAVSHLDPLDPPGLVIQGDSDGIVPASNAITFQAAARRIGYKRLNLDYVTTGPTSCRTHQSACGASVANIDRFFDQVVARTP